MEKHENRAIWDQIFKISPKREILSQKNLSKFRSQRENSDILERILKILSLQKSRKKAMATTQSSGCRARFTKSVTVLEIGSEKIYNVPKYVGIYI